MNGLALAALASALVSVSLASCGGGAAQPTADIVVRVPWPEVEALSYVLKDERGREMGSGRLSLEVHGDATDLVQQYSSGANRDQVTVVVDSMTLKPRSSLRLIGTEADPEEKDRLEVAYTGRGAVIKQGDRQSGFTVPEHAYDNDTSLFLWRTIDFHEGYSARYITMITNRRSKQTVELKVAGKEQVTVPAGQFDAWRLEIKAENAKQTAWYADTSTRPLVKYDNDRGTIFELQSRP